MVIGILLGLLIASFTYYNDAVVRNTYFIGNLIPVSIFGLLVVTLLAVNPGLRALGRRWPVRPAEIAVIVAIAYAACPWPGASFMLFFGSTTGLPDYLFSKHSSWDSMHLRSYIPGGSPELAEGYVRDWTAFADALAPETGAASPPVRRGFSELLDPRVRQLAADIASGRIPVTETEKLDLLAEINKMIRLEKPALEPPDLKQIVSQGVPETDVLHEVFGSELPAEVESRLAERRAMLERLVAEWPAVEEGEAALEEVSRPLRRLKSQRSLLNRVRVELSRLAGALQAGQPIGGGRLADLQSEMVAAELAPALAERLSAFVAELPVTETTIPAGPRTGQLAEQAESIVQTLEPRIAELDEQIAPVAAEADRLSHKLWKERTYVEWLKHEADRQLSRSVRMLLTHAYPDLITPMPRGEGIMLGYGEPYSELLSPLVNGWHGEVPITPEDTPWYAWWPVLRLWGSLALLLGVMGLCLALIVHPQWSQRELLPYPVIQFLSEVSEPGPKGWLPRVAKEKAFWVTFVLVAVLHLINGTALWFPSVPAIPLTFDLTAARQLFPYAAQVGESQWVFQPQLILSVFAFAYFLRTQVAVSLGLAPLAFTMLGAMLLSNGVPIQGQQSGDMGNMLRTGAFIAIVGMMLFYGRRYYWNVTTSAFGIRRSVETPVYATWAMRVAIACFALATVLLVVYAGLDPVVAVVWLALTLIIFIVVARLSAEAGLFFIIPNIWTASLLLGFFGIEGLGPEALIALSMLSGPFLAQPRTPMVAVAINGLRAFEKMRPGDEEGGGERSRWSGPARLAPWLAGMMILSFVVTIGVSLTIQYNEGTTPHNAYHRENQVGSKMWQMLGQVSELTTRGQLAEATAVDGIVDHVTHAAPDTMRLWWLAVGMALTLGMAFARLRFVWWPLHPILFLVWASPGSGAFALGFFLGGIVKAVVVRIGGYRLFTAGKPAMAGIIAGELLMALFWISVGLAYYLTTGKAPETYIVWVN